MSELTFEPFACDDDAIVAKQDGKTVIDHGIPLVLSTSVEDAESTLKWFVETFNEGCGRMRHVFPEGTVEGGVAPCIKCGTEKAAGIPVVVIPRIALEALTKMADLAIKRGL